MRPSSGESIVSNKSRGRRWTNQSRRQLVHPSSEHVRGRSSTGQPVPGPYPSRRGVSPRMIPIGHL